MAYLPDDKSRLLGDPDSELLVDLDAHLTVAESDEATQRTFRKNIYAWRALLGACYAVGLSMVISWSCFGLGMFGQLVVVVLASIAALSASVMDRRSSTPSLSRFMTTYFALTTALVFYTTELSTMADDYTLAPSGFLANCVRPMSNVHYTN